MIIAYNLSFDNGLKFILLILVIYIENTKDLWHTYYIKFG